MAQAGFVTRKTKVTLNYLEEKPEVYKLQQIVLPAVDFSTLIAEISNSCGVNASQTQAVVTALIDRIGHYVELGHGVKVGKLGTFKPTMKTKVSATLENLSTENIKLKYLRFYPGKIFKNIMSDMSAEVDKTTSL